MISTLLPPSRFRDRVILILSLLISLLIFRAYLVPNTIPIWFEQWHAIFVLHFGFQRIFAAGIIVCLLTGTVWGLYYPLVSKDTNSFGLWLVTGAWLGITIAAILFSSSNLLLVIREGYLLLGYVSGLVAATLFRRLGGYITALIVGGTIQALIAIVYQSKGIDTLLSGNVERAGGTFGTPSDLYLIPLFILPLAVQRIFSSSKTISSVFYMLCSASMFAILILTWERSGVMAACIGLFWLARKQIAGRKQMLGFAIALLLICGVFFVRGDGSVNYASSMGSIHSRYNFLKAGVLIFDYHWLNGVGVGSLSLPVSTSVHGQTESVQMVQPYNQYLYWLDEIGVVGGVLIALFFVFIYKTLSSSSSQIAGSVAAVWVSVAIAGLFNTLFGSNDFSCGNMLIGSLLGITMRLNSVDEKSLSQEVLEKSRMPIDALAIDPRQQVI